MKICKALLSLLMTCSIISSGVAMSASAADSDTYNDITYSTESKEEDQLTVPEQYHKVGSPSVEPTSQADTVAAASVTTQTPYNVFDIYDAHQKYVKLHSGDKSMMYKKTEGIDVSYAQGKIDWKTVKASGIDYAIIRAGYGNANKYPNQVDTWFKYNIEEAQKAGVDVGIYWYSYAFDTEAARCEAESCCQVIKDYNITYPVYFDIEEERHKQLSTAQVSSIIDTFCSTVESRGYCAGIYSFSSLLNTKIYQQVLDKYAVWVAHWDVAAPGYSYDYGMWQYNAKGRVNGISTEVDLDHCYINYPYLISPDTYKPDGRETDSSEKLYPLSMNKGVAKGIDVSVWQGKIEWDKVKASGIDYAVVRAGYGNDASQTDKYFKANIEGAEKAGLNCGVYWYSYATSAEDAVREAEACYEVIKGHKFGYPVYYAVEDASFASLSNQQITEIINAFCSVLEKKGYYVGVKSYANFLNTRIDPSVYSKYDVWVAHYGVSKPAFNKNFNMWQFTNEGKVNGIKGYVNCNYAYLDFPKVMKNAHINGF
ncbi:glycoside hydrolase family 25 protein [uncultured Ruminococcus sp.]|uniref:glycoside hydrolase family 25 protein n=1 Tax=uncultured Ruminococcus sp. TaxID=165186 RepID=UPI002629A866|nr:glycoside hydrolase family 25 protein [uncultured Ruminococcus sp.]